jgi:hypothetical protein
MTSIQLYDESDGAVPPELPPLPIDGLAAGTLNLLQQAAGLPYPVYIGIDDTQCITLQFDAATPSLKALVRWALRFGGMVVSEPHQTETGPQTWCRTEFRYYGVTVRAFAHIPGQQGQHLADQENSHE